MELGTPETTCAGSLGAPAPHPSVSGLGAPPCLPPWRRAAVRLKRSLGAPNGRDEIRKGFSFVHRPVNSRWYTIRATAKDLDTSGPWARAPTTGDTSPPAARRGAARARAVRRPRRPEEVLV